MSDTQSVWTYYTKRDGSFTYNFKCNLCGSFLQKSSMIIHIQKAHSIEVKEENVNTESNADQDLVKIGRNNILKSIGYAQGLNLPSPKEIKEEAMTENDVQNINAPENKLKIEDEKCTLLEIDDLSMENMQNCIKTVLDENITLRQQVEKLSSELAAFKDQHKNCIPIKSKYNQINLRSSNSKSHIDLVNENKKFKYDPKKLDHWEKLMEHKSSVGKKPGKIFDGSNKSFIGGISNTKIHIKQENDKDLKNTVRSNDSNEDLRRNITIDSVGVIQYRIKRETETDPEAINPLLGKKSTNHLKKSLVGKRLKTLGKSRYPCILGRELAEA